MTAAVRAARPDDLPAVAASDAECFSGHAYPPFFFRQALDAFGDAFLVAEADGSVAGYALGVFAAGATRGWILSMGVRPAFRGRGLASRLVDDVVERLSARGAREVLLTVDPANHAAVALYAKHGFREVAEEADYFGPGEPRLVLAKAVAG